VTNTIVASTTTAATNSTNLVVQLFFPNGTSVNSGEMTAGSLQSKHLNDQYLFDNITAGMYQLNFTNSGAVYFPATQVKVSNGVNVLNVTVYQLEVFHIIVNSGPTLNNTVPAPPISVLNDTVVQFVIYNNTTLIQNLAVVNTLYNSNYSNILFNSLSDSVSAGGTVNEIVHVSKIGLFYYECLIGNDAKDGEYGYFQVEI